MRETVAPARPSLAIFGPEWPAAGNNLQAPARPAAHRGRIFQRFVIERTWHGTCDSRPVHRCLPLCPPGSPPFSPCRWHPRLPRVTPRTPSAWRTTRATSPATASIIGPRTPASPSASSSTSSIARATSLEAKRVAWFADGSSDEDSVGGEGREDAALGARPVDHPRHQRAHRPSTCASTSPRACVAGFYGLGKDRKEFDERGEIPPGTYFGPLDEPRAQELRRQRGGRQAGVPHHRADAGPAPARHGGDRAAGLVDASSVPAMTSRSCST